MSGALLTEPDDKLLKSLKSFSRGQWRFSLAGFGIILDSSSPQSPNYSPDGGNFQESRTEDFWNDKLLGNFQNDISLKISDNDNKHSKY